MSDGGVSKTLNSIRSDADHVPCVIVYAIDHAVTIGGAIAQHKATAITKSYAQLSNRSERMLWQ